MRCATRSSAASPAPQGSGPVEGHGDCVVSTQPSFGAFVVAGDVMGGDGSSSAYRAHGGVPHATSNPAIAKTLRRTRRR
jgi:hypothetical protein